MTPVEHRVLLRQGVAAIGRFAAPPGLPIELCPARRDALIERRQRGTRLHRRSVQGGLLLRDFGFFPLAPRHLRLGLRGRELSSLQTVARGRVCLLGAA